MAPCTYTLSHYSTRKERVICYCLYRYYDFVHYDFFMLHLRSTDQRFYRRCEQTVQQQIILASGRENAAFTVSRLILSGVSPKPYAHTMESHDSAYIHTNVGTLSRPRSTSRRKYWEYSWTKRKEVDRREMRGMRRGRRDEACEGEGDAMRLINRHADNHSGFMVTTDYQVVQGDIFHIRDVTLFQWENTCSARYKLHERAYTRRHVCCIVSALVGTRKRELCIHVYVWFARPHARASRRLALGEASRCPVLLFFHLRSTLFPPAALVSKIIPTFSDYKNTRPLFRESDPLTDHRRHSTPTRYPLSRLERGLLTGAKTSLGVARQSWNFETTRPKGWNCNPW